MMDRAFALILEGIASERASKLRLFTGVKSIILLPLSLSHRKKEAATCVNTSPRGFWLLTDTSRLRLQ